MRADPEIVIPLITGDAVRGVLDIDSRSLGRFDDADLRGLTRIGEVFCASARFESGARRL